MGFAFLGAQQLKEFLRDVKSKDIDEFCVYMTAVFDRIHIGLLFSLGHWDTHVSTDKFPPGLSSLDVCACFFAYLGDGKFIPLEKKPPSPVVPQSVQEERMCSSRTSETKARRNTWSDQSQCGTCCQFGGDFAESHHGDRKSIGSVNTSRQPRSISSAFGRKEGVSFDVKLTSKKEQAHSHSECASSGRSGLDSGLVEGFF